MLKVLLIGIVLYQQKVFTATYFCLINVLQADIFDAFDWLDPTFTYTAYLKSFGKGFLLEQNYP